MKLPTSAPFISRWPLLGLATLCILLLAVLAVILPATTPAGAQDDYQPDQQLVANVWDYARETGNGFDHVLRWLRVLKTLGAVADMTAAEAQENADEYWSERWDPVVAELTELERAPDDYEPDQQLIANVWDYARETDSGFDHVLRWLRVLKTLGAVADMSAAEAQDNADQYWAERWDPVVEELQKLEAANADPEPTATPEPTPTPEPNRAPVVNRQAERYDAFVGTSNAPRGKRGWKIFEGIFHDPDGDELTYTASVSDEQSQLVGLLEIRRQTTSTDGDWRYILLLEADATADWNAVTPTLPDPLTIAVTVTATDPEGLSVSVSGDFITDWASHPALVSAVAGPRAIELTFDQAVEANPAPAPGQFTVNVANGDGTEGTVAVSGVSVQGKVVTLELASVLVSGQTVSLDYAHDDEGPLQRAAGGGDAAPGFTGQAVVVSLPDPPGEPENFAINAGTGGLDISASWDTLDGATSYKLSWRLAYGEFTAANSITTTETEATITVSGHGEWEARLQGCNDAGCGPEVEQAVTLIGLPGEPQNFAVTVVSGKLDVLATWDTVAGATSYKLRWRQSDGEFEADNAITVSGHTAVITVPEPVEWEVRLQGCNDAGCGPEASRSVDMAQELQLSLAPARDAEGNPRPKTITATWDPVPDAASYTLSWWPAGTNPSVPAQPDTARQTRAAPGAGGQESNGPGQNQLTVPGDWNGADFTVPDDGEYRAKLQANDEDNEVIAQDDAQVNQGPDQTDTTPPRIVRGEIDGSIMTIYFSEPLDAQVMGGRFYAAVQNPDGSWTGAYSSNMQISGNKVTVDFTGSLRAREYSRASGAYVTKPADPTVNSLRDLAGNVVRTPYDWPGGWRGTWCLALDNLTGRPYVTGLEVSSDAGADRYYVDGETIRVKLTFSEAVDVTGTPRVKIDLDPAAGGEKWADYSGGDGAEMLEFAYTVVAGDSSPDGVAVLRDTLELNGGTIRSASASGVENAKLAHWGLGHNPVRKVVTPATAAPVLFGATVDGATLTLTFSESLGAAPSLGNGAFTVKKTPQGGSQETVSLSGTPAIDGATVALTLANAVLNTDTRVKVSYEKPASGTDNRLIDQAGNDAASFSDERVTNTAATPDTTPPRLMRGEIDGDIITLYFSEPLDEHSGGEGDFFRVNVRRETWYAFTAEPREVEVTGNKVVVSLRHGKGTTRVIKWGNSLTYITPRDPTEERLQDISGNAVSTPYYYSALMTSTRDIHLENFTGVPSFQSAAAHPHWLTLTFDETLDENSVPAGSAFTVEVNGSAVSLADVDPVIVSGDTVTLVLASPVGSTDSATVRYVRPSGSPLRGVHGAVKSFPAQSATNMVGDVPAVSEVSISSLPFADGAYGLGQTIHVTLEFTEAVDVTGAPRLKIKMDPNWGEFWANYAGGTGTNTLTFAYQVVEPNTSPRGIAVLRGGLELNGGAIRSAAMATTDAHLWYGGLGHDPDHKVDWRRPGPQGPWVIGASITSVPAADDTYAFGETIRVTLEFTEAVDVAGAPRLKIKLGPGDGEWWANYESGTGASTLVFAYTVSEPDRSTQGVAVLENTLELNGGAIRSAGTPPEDAHLRHEGLDHDPKQQVEWRRSSPGIPWVTGVAVTSDPGDDAIYRLGETIDVTVTYSEAVNVDTTGGTPRLKINLDPDLLWGHMVEENNRWADYVSSSGAELTFGYTVVEGERSLRGVKVRGNSLELNGGTIRSATATPTDASLRHEWLDHDWNHRVDGETPALLSVTVHETTVAISYGEALDGDSVPPVNAFTVQRTPQGGAQETVSLSGSPRIAGGAVLLTLADPVLTTDTDVKVSYNKPTAGADRVKDKAGNEVDGFTGQAADPTDTAKPRLERGEIDGGTFTLYFSEALDEDSVGGSFRVHMWGGWRNSGGEITFNASGEVEISGNRVSVGLGNLRSSTRGENAQVHYRKPIDPTAERLRDLAGNELQSTRVIHLDNFTVPP